MLVAYQSLMASFLEPVSSLVNFGSTLGTYEQLWEEGGNYARLIRTEG
jgi:ABC-type bacteriocin/lantibiotic exporter with double-glycine peptidase domain